MKDLAQDVAEDVLGAAKDGNAKVFIVKVLIVPNRHLPGRWGAYDCLLHRHLPAVEPTPRLLLVDT